MSKVFDKFYLNNHPDGEVPQQVKRAVLLLVCALVLQMISSFLDEFNLSATIVTLGVFIFFIYTAGEGINAARQILLVLIILNLIFFICTVLYINGFIKNRHAKDNGIAYSYIALHFMELSAEIGAISLLFSKQANSWFNRKRQRKTTA